MSYKVINDNPFNVGIKFENESNREINIRGKSFVMLSENDILYVDSVSKLFRSGVLTTDNEEIMIKMGYVEKNANAITQEEIEKLFKLSAAKLKPELEKITAKHAIDKIVEVAKQSDLSTSRLNVVKEVLGVEIFDEVNEEIV